MNDLVIIHDEENGGAVFRARDFRSAARNGRHVQIVLQVAHDSWTSCNCTYVTAKSGKAAFLEVHAKVLAVMKGDDHE